MKSLGQYGDTQADAITVRVQEPMPLSLFDYHCSDLRVCHRRAVGSRVSGDTTVGTSMLVKGVWPTARPTKINFG